MLHLPQVCPACGACAVGVLHNAEGDQAAATVGRNGQSWKPPSQDKSQTQATQLVKNML